MHPLDEKVSAVGNFPAPADWRQLSRFLGKVGYYHRFCRNVSYRVA